MSTMVVYAATAAGHFFVGLIRTQSLPSLRVKRNPTENMAQRTRYSVEMIRNQEKTVNLAGIKNALTLVS